MKVNLPHLTSLQQLQSSTITANYVIVHFEVCRLSKLNSQTSENVVSDT